MTSSRQLLRTIQITFFLLIFGGTIAFASDLSDQYQECRARSQSAVQTKTCLAEELDRQDARLNMAYRDAMARLSPQGRSHLREAERAWIKWRDSKCLAAGDGSKAAAVYDYPLCMATEASSRADILEKSGVSAEYFVYSGDGISHSKQGALSIKLGERLPVSTLKRRFAGYKITATSLEDCMYCAQVDGNDGSFHIDYDSSGITVIGISSSDTSSSDVLGNRIGGSLGKAIGSSAICDAGDQTTCRSRKIEGLWYVPSEQEKCLISVEEAGYSNIPSCSKIEGFKLWKNSRAN